MNEIKTAQENAQEAIAMLKEAILTVVADATQSGDGIAPSAIRDKLEIQEVGLPIPPNNTKWGTVQIVYVVLHLLENICLKRMDLYNEVHRIKKIGCHYLYK